ncbi:hypothetical protein M422DRAFT_783672 [Sphaerobolus stellatus SS14]|uniref:Cytochrome P450 n=1 Tax=Sphaerobolus stellatus (strain SS14) TaxID=990650 RepID=A0A0C9V2S4_SPHS4|nr:hypothetical protein M422DRAFT_783672 [Sphaerobolus stellatus SS14]
MEFVSVQAVSAAIGALTAYVFITRLLRKPQDGDLSDLPRPPHTSLLAGNLSEFFEAENVGDTDAKWMQEYGTVFRLKAAIGSPDLLYTADPQAIRYVLDTRGYQFHKRDTAKMFRFLTGPTLVAAEGEEHARQRKMLLPGFSHTILKDLVPTCLRMSERVVTQWNELLLNEASIMVDIHSWLSRLTLDAIGQGVLSYDFGALADTPSEFLEAYRNVL